MNKRIRKKHREQGFKRMLRRADWDLARPGFFTGDVVIHLSSRRKKARVVRS